MKASKLFQAKDPSDRRTLTHKVRVNAAEDIQLRHNAAIRQMDLSEFYRRTGLGRRADVDYDQDIVLALGAMTRAVRDFHAALVERGLPTPDEILLPVITEAVSAIKRIEGKRAE